MAKVICPECKGTGKVDDELKRIYQTGNTDMKRAAGYLLRQRGY